MQQPQGHSLDSDILEFPKHSNATESTKHFISEEVAPPPKTRKTEVIQSM